MAEQPQRDIVDVKGVSQPLGTYNHAIIASPGRLMFVAGQVAVDEGGGLVGPNDLASQMRQVFHNLGQVLASGGASFRNVVQFTTYLVRTQKVEDFLTARREIFPDIFPDGDYPTNTLLVIEGLVKPEFLLEIEAIAALP